MKLHRPPGFKWLPKGGLERAIDAIERVVGTSQHAGGPSGPSQAAPVATRTSTGAAGPRRGLTPGQAAAAPGAPATPTPLMTPALPADTPVVTAGPSQPRTGTGNGTPPRRSTPVGGEPPPLVTLPVDIPAEPRPAGGDARALTTAAEASPLPVDSPEAPTSSGVGSSQAQHAQATPSRPATPVASGQAPPLADVPQDIAAAQPSRKGKERMIPGQPQKSALSRMVPLYPPPDAGALPHFVAGAATSGPSGSPLSASQASQLISSLTEVIEEQRHLEVQQMLISFMAGYDAQRDACRAGRPQDRLSAAQDLLDGMERLSIVHVPALQEISTTLRELLRDSTIADSPELAGARETFGRVVTQARPDPGSFPDFDVRRRQALAGVSGGAAGAHAGPSAHEAAGLNLVTPTERSNLRMLVRNLTRPPTHPLG